MYRIKIKEYLYRTSITLQRKIFGFWIYSDGWNVKSTSDYFRKRETNKIINRLNELHNLERLNMPTISDCASEIPYKRLSDSFKKTINSIENKLNK